jgi:apolipoprotein N-acyltransferase
MFYWIMLVLGAVCYFAALPPLGLGLAAFLVPICWYFVIDRPEPIKLRWVYLSALLFWIASIWWIACPHPLTSLGLVALAAYLSIYWVLFFATSGIAVRRLHLPASFAIPVCWVGCEFLRFHLLGGFSFCALEHALYRFPVLIQMASFGGEYLVGGLMMFFGSIAAGIIKESWKNDNKSGKFKRIFIRLIIAFGVLQFVAAQSIFRLPSPPYPSPLRIAALQGNIPVSLNPEPDYARKTFRQFADLSFQAVTEAKKIGKPLDLIVFPETVCPINALYFNGSTKPSDLGWTDEEAAEWENQLRAFVQQLDTPVLFGLSAFVFENNTDPKRLNSALLVEPKTDEMYRYDKVHLVMFGEYIPFSEYLPDNFFLKTLCQEAGRGNEPVAFPLVELGVNHYFYASVNICFESSIPHLIRNQIKTLKKQRKEPSVLINISNDGWFWFSQQIDQHLATHVFRAVENRRPYVSATNGGFSVFIDPYGNIKQIGKRGAAEAVVGEVQGYSITPLYHHFGWMFPIPCMAFALFLLLFGIVIPNALGNSVLVEVASRE